MKAFWLSVWTTCLVLGTSFLGIILSHVALGVGSESMPWPRLGVVAIFFWMLHRPKTMTIPMIFLLGLAQDMILGDVVGTGVLGLLVAALSFDRMLPMLRTMPLGWRWLGFGGFMLLAFTLQWALTSAARLAFQPVDLIMWQGVATFLIYPLVSIALRQVLRIGRTRRRTL